MSAFARSKIPFAHRCAKSSFARAAGSAVGSAVATGLIALGAVMFATGDVFAAGGATEFAGGGERIRAAIRDARAAAGTAAGDAAGGGEIVVRLPAGTYFLEEPLTFTGDDLPFANGTGSTAAAPRLRITAGDPANPPVISGGVPLGKFEVVRENLWRVRVPETVHYGFRFEQLYVNGERRFRAQTPNRGEFFRVASVTETRLDNPAGDAAKKRPDFALQKITVHKKDAAFLPELLRPFNSYANGSWATPADIATGTVPGKTPQSDALVTFYHAWDTTKKTPVHVVPNENAFFIAGEGMKPWNKINASSRYIVENYEGALDAAGEWFLRRDGWLYYIPLAGETPENTRAVAPALRQLLIITGTKEKPAGNVVFDNVRFEHTAYNTPPAGKEPMQAASPADAAIMLNHTRGVVFENCAIAHTGSYAIWFQKNCRDAKIERCHIYDLGAGGVKIGMTAWTKQEVADGSLTGRITLNNNIIQHGGNVLPCAVGVVLAHTSDNQITHNDIGDFRYSGVSAGWVWGYAESPSKRNKITHNHIHHLGWGELCDMGGVYTLGASEGTSVSNNRIHDIHSHNYGGWGLYTDEGSFGILMENNLVYRCKDSSFHQHYGRENIIRNNIFAFAKLAQVQLTRLEKHRSFSFTNNILFYDAGETFRLGWTSIKSDTLPAHVFSDKNLFWDLRKLTKKETAGFAKKTFLEWQAAGLDKNSIWRDPLFAAPKRDDFRFRPDAARDAALRAIDFVPFDYTAAGVYGDPEWKARAEFPPALLKEWHRRTGLAPKE
ncbi:MAG: right-handed parallel beta-helix repeat-containing protein [Puniceicoccales bacterium]|jgi:hypothetical protein|nr:right-handed parallel beta-helix repeat-containing protein [Puniceicoccales bacterium]